jgi:hypothetical protein
MSPRTGAGAPAAGARSAFCAVVLAVSCLPAAVVGSPPAAAATATATTAARVGTVTLYDATGQQVTGGALSARPLAAYALASASLPGTGATLAVVPDTAGADPPRHVIAVSPRRPSAPPPALRTVALPMVAVTRTAPSLGDALDALPGGPSPPSGRFQLRVVSGTGPGSFAAVTIAVDGARWHVVAPKATAVTLTALDVPPDGHRGELMLVATMTPVTATGVVELLDNGRRLGGSMTSTIRATWTPAPLATGAHRFTVRFLAAAPYHRSTSNAVVERIAPTARVVDAANVHHRGSAHGSIAVHVPGVRGLHGGRGPGTHGGGPGGLAFTGFAVLLALLLALALLAAGGAFQRFGTKRQRARPDDPVR